MKPIRMAGIGSTKPAAGVMATRPAMQPDAAPSTVGLPLRTHSRSTQLTVAAAAAPCEAMKAFAARPFAPSAEPALKPNQPNQRSVAPSTVIGRLCGSMADLP